MNGSASSNKGLHILLLVLQVLLGMTLLGAGIWKIVTPVNDLASKMPWMGQVSTSFLYLTALFDSLCGLGLFLPSITRIMPRLAVLAALGTVGLMLGAIVFHFSRGEGANTPFNFVLIGLSLVIAWGRTTKAPIAARVAARD